MEVQLHVFLTSTLDGGDWSVSRPSRSTPRDKARCTNYIGDCVVAVVKRNNA